VPGRADWVCRSSGAGTRSGDRCAKVREAPAPPPHNLPAPTEETLRYVGLWATTAEGCSNPAWRFERDGISTRGEVSCEFNSVRPIPSGYEIARDGPRAGPARTAQYPDFIRGIRPRHDADRRPLGPGAQLGLLPRPIT
jgi:hypothetical protein